MSARYYDEALLKKIKNWCNGLPITITGVDETHRIFEVIADKQDDKPITLPLITISRNGGYTILNKQKQPKTFNGFKIAQGQQKSMQLNCIPIELQYQIDIYTRYFSECDEYVRNFIFNIINYPKLEIEIPYNDADFIHYSNIRLADDVADNSSIPERLIAGQFSRFSLTINIDDAYLFDTRLRDNCRLVEIDTQVEDLPRELVWQSETIN